MAGLLNRFGQILDMVVRTALKIRRQIGGNQDSHVQ